MKKPAIALLIYGEKNSGRDALKEDKYRDLATAFLVSGYEVKSVLYHDEESDQLASELIHYDAILVWVNPIEHDRDRKILDALLIKLSLNRCFVSAHPEVIIKMGTKEVLFATRNMAWGTDTKIYRSFDDFKSGFYESLRSSGIRVLKQCRGNGGSGVFKIKYNQDEDYLTVIHAKTNSDVELLSWNEFYRKFGVFFPDHGLLIDQEWNKNITNGMVRCYLSGTKVAGFGYQEINALYELNHHSGKISASPGKRYYFTENCGLFSDLRIFMENSWVPQLQELQAIPKEIMPVIWDADFFINKTNGETGKYTLCEINVSCVSPFPPSAIRYIVEEVIRKLQK